MANDKTGNRAQSPQETPAPQEAHSTVVGLRKNDGTLDIRITDDKLEAFADFNPPTGDGATLSPDYISTILERLGIVNGIDWDAIQASALECNLNRHVIKDIRIAKGLPPEDEVLDYYETKQSFRVWPRVPDGDVPRIDWREISPFVVVKKGDILATRHERVIGKTGMDIFGNMVNFPVKRPEGAKCGPNTHESDGAIYASCDGRLVEKGTELMVEEILEIRGGVGYKTGHIVFPGDVVIDGPVADGFKVYAGGSIIAKQTFDATEVVTKKDLIVAGGIIGRGHAAIRVGGSVRAKFIQNATIASRGPLMVGTAVINSHIYTLQTLDLGDKGKLIGGEVFAVKGVRAQSIGNETGSQPKIHCGIDFTVQQELDRTNEHLRIIALKLSKLREHMAKGGENAEQLKTIEGPLKKELEKLGMKVGELLGKLDSHEGATVEVSGTVLKGTLIEICHVAYVVEAPLKRVRFKLDKSQGRLVHENLQ